MTRSMLRRLAAPCLLLLSLSIAPGCAHLGGSRPPVQDLIAVTEPKPIPGDDIVSDPVAAAHYDAAIEARGDRLYAAGARLCRFFARTGMKGLDCPKE